MRAELTCAIVRDLLPCYVEGLTSRETSEAVEVHLAACPDCARLRAELSAPPVSAAEPVKEVDYLKMIRRRNRRRVLLAVLCTLLLVVGGFAASLFLIGSTADVGSMAWEGEVKEDVLYLNVMSAVSANAYCGWETERDENGVVDVTVRSVLVSAIHPDGSGTVQVPLDGGVTEVRLLGKPVWQDGILIDRSTLRLYEARTPYIGNAVALGEIADALNLRGYCGDYTTSLHTSSRPYEWKLSFIENRNIMVDYDGVNWELRYLLAPKMLALVDNLDQVSWTYTDESGEIQLQALTLEEANADLAELAERYSARSGTDWTPPASIKDYADSLADFQRLCHILSSRISSVTYSGTVEDVEEPPVSIPAPDGAYHFVSEPID